MDARVKPFTLVLGFLISGSEKSRVADDRPIGLQLVRYFRRTPRITAIGKVIRQLPSDTAD